MAMRPSWPPYLLACCFAASLAADLQPWISFHNRDSRRRINLFKEQGVLHFDTFLPSGKTLYVGARDTLLALGTDNAGSFELKGKILWRPTSSKTQECIFKKSGDETECFNFIRVLVQLNETHLYTCGTYAYSPTCAYIDRQTFSLVKKKNGDPVLEDGQGVSPFNPRHQSTALVVDGELYTGTMSNFLGSQPVISRTLGSRTRLKTDTFLNWLYSDTAFVAAFDIPVAPDNEKVYFFFAETVKDLDILGRLRVSRVARVCKNDVGGEKLLQKKWTTFLKAHITCSEQGQFPFTIVQHVFALPQAEGDGAIFYGVFTSPWKLGDTGSSAVCVFDLGAIRDAFEGNYKEYNRDCSRLMTYRGPSLSPHPGSCSVGSSSDKALEFMKEHPLMDETILPTRKQPLLVKWDVKYTRIAVHQTSGVSGTHYNMLFLGTDRGALHKAVVVSSGVHIIESVQLFADPEPVRNLLLSPEKAILYVGYSKGVLQVPLANCSLYGTCSFCIMARDPYCAWDSRAHQCKNIHSGMEDVRGWLQDVDMGNPRAKCVPIKGRSRNSLSSSDDSDGNLVTTLTPPLNSMVRLTCTQASDLANYTWTYPSSGILAGLVVEHGNDLVVVVQRATLGTYECRASENGFLQTVARYSVLSPHLPHFRRTDLVEEKQAASEGKQRSYWVQFVTVTVLLSMTLAVVVAVAAFSYHSRMKAKSKVHGCSNTAARQERVPLSDSHIPPQSSSCHQGHGPAAVQDTGMDNNRLGFGLANRDDSIGATAGV